MHNFRDLKVWKKSRGVVKQCYLLTNSFPKSELFSLTSQIRRAAVSIPANIAEGAGRNTDAQFAHFLDIANGSACELETLLILSVDLNFLQKESAEAVLYEVDEIQKMIRVFKRKLS